MDRHIDYIYYLFIVAVFKNETGHRPHAEDLLCALLSMDFLSFYLNSVLSQPVYVNEKPVGLIYRVNFFSSYMNPLGIVLTEKWQWILYLLIRFILAVVLMFLLIAVQSLFIKQRDLARNKT